MKKRLYFTIIVLTLLVFIDKYYIYNDLEIIKKDIEVINLAGSQRMRSQKIIKLNENDYLNLMDKIVMEYKAIGQQRIAKIESRENILNTMVVLIFLNIFFMSGFEILKKKKKANLA